MTEKDLRSAEMACTSGDEFDAEREAHAVSFWRVVVGVVVGVLLIGGGVALGELVWLAMEALS